MRRLFSRCAAIAFIAMFVAACDKCGQPVKFVSPSLPKACGDNADPGRG